MASTLAQVMKELKLPGESIKDFKAEWDKLSEQDKVELAEAAG